MTESTTRTALITGVSRGLGLALARRLARDSWHLIVDARGAEALEVARAELARLTQIIAIPGDVPDDKHRRALSEAAHDVGGLDALVTTPVPSARARNRSFWTTQSTRWRMSTGPTSWHHSPWFKKFGTR